MIWNVVVQVCYFELILLRKISQSSNRNMKVSFIIKTSDLERQLIGLSRCMIPKHIASNIYKMDFGVGKVGGISPLYFYFYIFI